MEQIPIEARAFLILFARVGAVLMLLPVFSDDAIPGRVRLLLALGMTTALWGLLSPSVMVSAASADALPGVLIGELLTGLGIGALVRIMFLAMATAGSIISLQIGMTSILVPDSMQGGSTSILSRFVSVAAGLVCMALLVHHQWIAAIIDSYRIFPVGGMPPSGDFAALAVSTVSKSMALAVSLAAPFIIYAIVFNTALGLSARLAPAIQIFFIAQPLNIVFGLALFASLLGIMLTTFAGRLGMWMQTALGG